MDDFARTLFEQHFDAVYRFFATKITDGIEDLVQDTFVACIESRARLEAATSERAFILGIARHLLFDAYRKRGRGRETELGESCVADLEPSPSSVFARKDEERLLLEGLRQLPLDHQIALELYEWEGLRAIDVAAVLGITEGAVRGRVHRAKEDLRAALERIASSREVLESTLHGLDGWARGLRARLGRAESPS